MRWRLALGAIVAAIPLGLATGCVNLALPLVDEDPPFAAPTPSLDPVNGWTDPARRAAARDAFEREVYGRWPGRAQTTVSARETLDAEAYGGRGTLERWTLSIERDAKGAAITLPLTVVVPNGADGPVPLFLMGTFCADDTSFAPADVPGPSAQAGGPGLCGNAVASLPITYIFGRHAGRKPIADFLDAGVAVAGYYPGEMVPDALNAGDAALETHFGDLDPRPGAIMAWAWGLSRLVDALDADPRFDRTRTTVYGHSRHGKAAIVAAAFDERIDRVISHQSGRGGTSLSRSSVGESVGQITEGFPHWFTRGFAGFSERTGDLSVDQHQLLALVAPRPVLIGGARRDRWSDPASAWAAATAVDPVYEAQGSEGLDQPTMAALNLDADLAYHLRNGRHGQTTADFKVFIRFAARP